MGLHAHTSPLQKLYALSYKDFYLYMLLSVDLKSNSFSSDTNGISKIFVFIHMCSINI